MDKQLAKLYSYPTLAFESKETIVVGDLAHSPLLSERLREKCYFIKSAWVVPLMSGEKAVGMFAVGYGRQREGSSEELSFLQLLGDEAALAIERARLTEKLREREAKFHTLAETVAACTFIYQGTKLRYVNSAAQALTGYTQEELAEMNFWDVIHPDFRELVRERGLARQQGRPVPSEYEVKIVTKKGEERWLAFTGGVIEFEGKPAGLGTAFDITERKRVEEALRKSEVRYRNLFENANDGIVSFSLDGTITNMNQGLEKMLGWSREELIGQHYRKIVTPASAALGEERTRRALAREKLPAIFAAEFVRKDGSTVSVEGRDRFIRNQEGNPIAIQAIYRDISAKKELEQQRADFWPCSPMILRTPWELFGGTRTSCLRK